MACGGGKLGLLDHNYIKGAKSSSQFSITNGQRTWAYAGNSVSFGCLYCPFGALCFIDKRRVTLGADLKFRVLGKSPVSVSWSVFGIGVLI